MLRQEMKCVIINKRVAYALQTW